MSIGPALPPGWKPPAEDDDEDSKDHSEDDRSKSRSKSKSPTSSDIGEERTEEADQDCYGPALPPDLVDESVAGSSKDRKADEEDDDEDDDDLPVGPLPESESAEAYAYRLYKLRREKEEEEDIRKRKHAREEWMVELPSKLSKSYGLTARTFKKNAGASGGDLSVWTDTPEEQRQRSKKPTTSDVDKDEKALMNRAAAERDRKFDAEVERMNEKRSKESLLDTHNKKKQKELDEAEKSGTKTGRRPFDREKDMKIINLRPASERNSMVDKAKLLDTKFGHSSSQKYL